MLMRTDPFREIDRLAEQFFGTTARPAVMHLDAYRDGDFFYAAFDLPGVDPDSIDCTVERNVLTVRAERRRATGDNVELVAAERPMGTFTRQLFLGDSLDADKLEAGYENGVLTLRIPVAERAKPRRISITATASGNGRRQISA
ncbi:Hsp20/alpha crystallin family protein [Micromonospora sp. NPDC047738]|uniref:Hsp20/alpha crystallin family protein n=1 Tax=unclassified Micromonospora TaxID=2617518 RepID=UPI0033EB1348